MRLASRGAARWQQQCRRWRAYAPRPFTHLPTLPLSSPPSRFTALCPRPSLGPRRMWPRQSDTAALTAKCNSCPEAGRPETAAEKGGTLSRKCAAARRGIRGTKEGGADLSALVGCKSEFPQANRIAQCKRRRAPRAPSRSQKSVGERQVAGMRKRSGMLAGVVLPQD